MTHNLINAPLSDTLTWRRLHIDYSLLWLVVARVPARKHRPLWLGARLTGGLVNPEWARKTQFTWGRQRVGLWHPHWLPPGPASALSTSAALHFQGNCTQQIFVSYIGHLEVSNELYFRKATSQHGDTSTSALRLPCAFRASIWDRKSKAPRPQGGKLSHASPVGLSFQACPSLRRWVTQSSHSHSTDPHNHKTVFGTKTLMWACLSKTFISAWMEPEDSTLSEISSQKDNTVSSLRWGSKTVGTHGTRGEWWSPRADGEGIGGML